MIRRFSHWLTILFALIILGGVIFYNHFQIRAQASRPAPAAAEIVRHPDVSVITTQSGRFAANVTAFGEADPHYELTLAAQVAGQVVSLTDNFEPGQRVKKGTVLVQLEDSQYRAAVAEAEKNLSDARLSLLEEKRQVQQALAEWTSSGLDGEPDSDLVLRKPQLEAAEAAVANAEAALASARENLKHTRISAPFDALVVERKVAPGSYLAAGGEVATLYSTDRVEIAVSLPANDWRKLPESSILNGGTWPAQLFSAEDGQNWTGRILRTEQHLEGTTRQRQLIVAVDQPLDLSPKLLPGSFLTVSVQGREVDRLWKLPSSALSQKGEIWYVTKENTLASFTTEPVFSDSQSIYVQVPFNLAQEPQKVLVHPLSSYLTAMVVNPVEELGHE